MDFAGMNYIAIVVAGVASFLFGAAWYNVLSKPWRAAAGVSDDQIKASNAGANMARLLALTLVAQLVMAWVLAGLIGHLGDGQVTVSNGLISGAFVWAGFVATTLVVNHGFALKLGMLTIIDGLYWLGVLMIQGGIIGAFGV